MNPETVRSMLDRKAKIVWQCEVAKLSHGGAADLTAIARKRGGDFTLANRRPACRIPGCPGRVRFIDRSSTWPKFLDTITDKDDEWWDYSEAEKERLKALGWRLEMGYWQAPEPERPTRPIGSPHDR